MYGTTSVDDLQDPPLPGGICMTHALVGLCLPPSHVSRSLYFSNADLPGTWYMIPGTALVHVHGLHVHGLHVQPLTPGNPVSTAVDDLHSMVGISLMCETMHNNTCNATRAGRRSAFQVSAYLLVVVVVYIEYINTHSTARQQYCRDYTRHHNKHAGRTLNARATNGGYYLETC